MNKKNSSDPIEILCFICGPVLPWMDVKGIHHMPKLPLATLALAEHRPETFSHAAALMRDHEAVFLEEPPDASFQQMLRGDLPVEEYVLTLDAEYPAFIHCMCRALRELSGMGISIYQVDPYLEHLVAIHEFFSSGGSPEKLDPHHVQHEVYLAEKQATAALLDFYKTATAGSFEETLQSVKRFALVCLLGPTPKDNQALTQRSIYLQITPSKSKSYVSFAFPLS